jgi:hypothetical protein
VLTSSGYVADPNQSLHRSFGDSGVAAYVGPDEFLTATLVSDFVAQADAIDEALTVFYFRASEDFDVNAVASAVTCRRVPYQLGL